jgi:hypothetical protein
MVPDCFGVIVVAVTALALGMALGSLITYVRVHRRRR